MSYAVKEIFLTLQGEGGQAGRPAVFCRFAGCNLWSGLERDRATAVCTFCDTDFVGMDGEGGGRFADAHALAAAVEAACADYGQALGTAFQVIDDVLDYAGDAKVMGKSLGDDLREGKATLPLILAMQRGTPAQRDLVKSAIETGSVDRLNEVIAIVRETGALDGSRQAAMAEAQRAINAAQIEKLLADAAK